MKPATLLLLGTSTLLIGCGDTPPHPIADQINQNMITIEGGSFTMGSDTVTANKSERPARVVTINSFQLSKYEVTQEIFEAVMGSSNSYFKDPNVPVNNLSWQQANYFISQLNILTGEAYRLPTEAEWEFAAKGGIYHNHFHYSGSNQIEDVAWYSGNANNRAHPVGLKQPNELGLYDMTGNIGEFVSDAFDDTYYRYGPKINPNNNQDTDIGLAHKSVRGGSFAYNANESENFRRDFASQSVTMSDMGLRLAKDN
ncbi:TPA: formylglycine-generating enzyme family protein [Photobacterium damselae]